jgi:hypothetical protein
MRGFNNRPSQVPRWFFMPLPPHCFPPAAMFCSPHTFELLSRVSLCSPVGTAVTGPALQATDPDRGQQVLWSITTPNVPFKVDACGGMLLSCEAPYLLLNITARLATPGCLP